MSRIDVDDNDDTTVLTKPKRKVKPPSLYTVVFLNDDYTPMAFVVEVLIKVFHLSEPEAVMIMLKVHKEGRANVGQFTYEVAEQKVGTVRTLAIRNQHPLQAYAEKL